MSDIRLVDHPTLFPAQCMFTESTGPCLDFLRDFHPGHEGRIYISVRYAREIGRAVGLDDPTELTERIGLLVAVVDELKAENERLQQFEDAAQYTLSHLGARVRNKPGPKGPRVKEVA